MSKWNNRKSSIDDMYCNDEDWEDLYFNQKKRLHLIGETMKKGVIESKIEEYSEHLTPSLD